MAAGMLADIILTGRFGLRAFIAPAIRCGSRCYRGKNCRSCRKSWGRSGSIASLSRSHRRSSGGMGAEVESALRTRRQWLIEQGLAREQGGQVRYARDLLRTLEARELSRTAANISARAGLEHLEVKTGDSLTGRYKRMLTLNSGRYALIERSHDFALVPWRPVLERARGQMVTGSVGGEGISWSIGIKRGIGR